MIIHTDLSAGFTDLIRIFFRANELEGEITTRYNKDTGIESIDINIVDNSPTAVSITMMSYRNSGVNNMLSDYLIKTGVDPLLLSTGKTVIARNLKQVDQDWEEYRKTIGLR